MTPPLLGGGESALLLELRTPLRKRSLSEQSKRVPTLRLRPSVQERSGTLEPNGRGPRSERAQDVHGDGSDPI